MSLLLVFFCVACFACRCSPRVRLGLAGWLLAAVMLTSGCRWLDRGSGFQEWNSGLTNGLRGDGKAAKPSGFFFDRRAEEIEKNLGGGF